VLRFFFSLPIKSVEIIYQDQAVPKGLLSLFPEQCVRETGGPNGQPTPGERTIRIMGDDEKSRNPVLTKPVFDEIGLLDATGGDAGLLKRLVSIFLHELPLEASLLKEALDDNDALRTTRQAHKLKGAAANMHAETLRQLFHDIEAAAKENNMDDARNLFHDFVFHLESLKTVCFRREQV
jgi:HPt (histidine-containing phosphotransfer) domain-containing protein